MPPRKLAGLGRRTVKLTDRLADNTKDSMPKQDSDKPTSAKLKRRKPVQCSAMVRTHRGFWMETPDGHDVHILGDHKMPVATRKALGAMMDAAYKAAARGELKLRPNADISDRR